MIIIKSEIGERLRYLRKQKEDTLNNVSEASGINLTILSKIERGERLPTREQLSSLANYYKYNKSELKTLLIAEKIIKDYGISVDTHKAISLVEKQIIKYLKK
jgi:transcriptional regulator with XRE-family HTH domain